MGNNMKKICFNVLLWVLLLILNACSVQPNIAIVTTPGNCPNGQSNAPYCIAVQVQNNPNGQNWISSTNFPFANLTITTSNASNILTPSNASSLDPNHCTSSGSLIAPGSSCTFYLQLSSEMYAVESTIPVSVNIQYTVNNDLSSIVTGSTSGGTTYNYTFWLYEHVNLYAVQPTGTNNITVYSTNSNSTPIVNYYTAESTNSGVTIYSTTTDNSTYGYLWLGTNSGIQSFGNGNSNSISPNPQSGNFSFTNLFTSQPSPIESTPTQTMYASSNSSLYEFNFPSSSWESYPAIITAVSNNINAFGGGYPVLASSNQVYTVGTNTYYYEGLSFSGVNINALGFATTHTASYTGLYVGTSGGLYVESGASFPSSSNTWTPISISGSPSISTMTTDASGNVYVGTSSGNIYIINAGVTPTTVNLFGNFASFGIAPQKMIFDNIGNVLYVASNSNVYTCTATSCQSLGAFMGSANVIGLAIGSSFSNQ